MSQRTKKEHFCKNHESELGTFFLADQPWVKFCSECALNMALCGKKIDKQLSGQQFDNKTQVVSIIERINHAIGQVQPSKKIIDHITQKMQKICQSELGKAVKNFDDYVRHLCQVRDEVVQIFQTNFCQSIQSYFEKQTRILLSQIQLKKSLQYIQGNYRNIIANKNPNQNTNNFQEWDKLVSQIQRLMPTQGQLVQVEEHLMERIGAIVERLSAVEPFKFHIPENQRRKTEYRFAQGLGTFESVTFGQQSKQNHPRKTQLKLRSKSRQSEKRSDRQSLKTRKSIRDVTNFQIMESFHI